MWYNYPTIFDKLNLFYLRASYGCDFGHFMASSGNHCPSWKCIILASGNDHEMEKGKMIHFQGPLAKFARKPWPLFFVSSRLPGRMFSSAVLRVKPHIAAERVMHRASWQSIYINPSG